MKFFEDFEAPPIKNPSNSIIFLKFLIFLLSTEPPYKTFGTLLVPKIFLGFSLLILSYQLSLFLKVFYQNQ